MSEGRPHRAKIARPRVSRRSQVAPARPRGPDDFLVVGIGASAGGLDACMKLVNALPTGNHLALILVQHLDPVHKSMMVDLLASHTSMIVRQAAEGMPLEPDHLYVIPPGTYLSVGNDALHILEPQARHGARLPFDFLLHTLAAQYGERAVCVILSGTGADGSLGLKAVKDKKGLVIAQDPDEADYDGMPRSAIMTGAVDLVLPAAKIPEALVKYDRRVALARTPHSSMPQDKTPDLLPEIVDLLRTKTGYDFTLYKPGTLHRRIARRMAMASIESADLDRYLEILRSDTAELDLLAKDLLINVTSFFRDPKVFDLLAEQIIPDLINRQPSDQPLRIWTVGCSTGEETYSLAMLFREAMTAAKRHIKLQIFASDVDPDAVASAREGLYPEAIATDVSPERLARFFIKEKTHYRVLSDLRDLVVFTVHNVLTDPPFSRLDLVSCRNLLIYLRPQAQEKLVSLFHFALREGGILLLGGSETIGNANDHFAVISKSARLYRHIGRSRPGEFGFLLKPGDGVGGPKRPSLAPVPTRQAGFAELCRRLVIESYAPATVLINGQHECLYSLGPTEHYLRVAPGQPTLDLFAMAAPAVRTMLRAAIQQVRQENRRVVLPGGRMSHAGNPLAFSIAVQPVPSEGQDLLLVCFIEEPRPAGKRGRPATPQELSRVAELEQELEATKRELQGAIGNLETASEEQLAVNEEAMSVNEEYQSTNEELLTSKEELQSLNEELTALNSQLQETLERQRTTSNDLQNILYSTNVATLFLDTNLNIRFFTPATKLLFGIIPSDVGRPLADLSALAADNTLLSDARTVLRTIAPVEREIEARSGAWYNRRISPYRAQDDGVEGVVITFTDTTARRHVADALGASKREAELASLVKSRFLAAASHDLRQPLQTLTLLQGLLAKSVDGDKAQKLLARFDETLGAMSGMLNTLLDINQIEAGTVDTEMASFPINDLLERLRDEFTYHAEAKGLTFHVVPCGLVIRSDPRLLEQMIRNLLSNALKYTEHGKVLLGCRRHGGLLSVEIWDTGIGIPQQELRAIFEEYHQLGNPARERSLGLGLGLSIVQRLGNLLGHRVQVRSNLGKGSVFGIEIMLSQTGEQTPTDASRHGGDGKKIGGAGRKGVVLVVEDDPDLRDLLRIFLEDEGHRALTVPDGVAALEAMQRDATPPDLILTDYNLPKGMNGVELTVKLREVLRWQIPAIILTGDITPIILRGIAGLDCVRLNKPVKLPELTNVIERLLVGSAAPARVVAAAGNPETPVISIVDDDAHVRAAIRSAVEESGRVVADYATAEEFLEAYRPGGEACLLVDAYLPGMSGLALLQRLRNAGDRLPAIIITGHGDVRMAVQAMKAGALDFIEKPVGKGELLAIVAQALEGARDATALAARRNHAASRIGGLTARQRQIMELVLAGHPNKNIAADLGVSQRTVENHRAAIMRKTGAKSLPALARLALTAASIGAEGPVVQGKPAAAGTV